LQIRDCKDRRFLDAAHPSLPVRRAELNGTHDLVSAIAYEVLRRMSAVIVTGGFLHSSKNPDTISTDTAALKGARLYCEEYGVELASRFEAWVPEPGLDRGPDVGGAVRMSEADGIAVRTLAGKTPVAQAQATAGHTDAKTVATTTTPLSRNH
jgi:hypothetical protein